VPSPARLFCVLVFFSEIVSKPPGRQGCQGKHRLETGSIFAQHYEILEAADQRSDIYSLGAILYEMVTGRVPFKGDTALSVALKHKTQIPVDPRKLTPGISDDLSHLILICMEKEKEKRYQSVEDLLLDLAKLEAGVPLTKGKKRSRKLFEVIFHRPRGSV
jgi:serine/threonine protein kinase